MNYIPTAFRVLALLQLFLKYRMVTFSTFQAEIASSSTEETLHKAKDEEPLSLSVFRKYVKTLRFLGCRIKTVNRGKTEEPSAETTQAYQLEQHPFPWIPTQTEWLLFVQLFSRASQAERKTLAPLIWRLSPTLKKPLNTKSIPLHPEKPYERQIPAFLKNAFSEDLQQCIKKIESIQQTGDGILLWLRQEKPNNASVVLLNEQIPTEEQPAIVFHNMPLLSGIPQQLALQEQGTLQLIVEDIRTYQQYRVPLALIEGVKAIPVEQLLPLRSTMVDRVQFKITGKLVASYEKRANETIIQTKQDDANEGTQALLIEAKDVEVSSLFQRLKRYGQFATVVDPLGLRHQFLAQLEHQHQLIHQQDSSSF